MTAKKQELLSAFVDGELNEKELDQLLALMDSDDNARLLAISAILQGSRSVGDMSELLANIKSDMQEDGTLDSEALIADLYVQSQELDADAIRDNLHARYEDQGGNPQIPDFSDHLQTFRDLYNPFDVSATMTDVTCNPASRGSISLNIVSEHPPVTILWSNGETGSEILDLDPGIYEVRITDYFGYVYSESFEVKDQLRIVPQVTHESLSGNDGGIDLDVTGGVAPYTYSWSTGASTENIQGLSTGQYEVTVSDADGCTRTRKVPVKGEVEDDRDGRIYQTILIGQQLWMAENLNVGTFLESDLLQADNDVIEKHCLENSETASDSLGGLYQWDELMDYPLEPYDDLISRQGICPAGWHVPNRDEWELLAGLLGGSEVAGGKLKDVGGVHWWMPNVGASNEVGFTAISNGEKVNPDENYGEFASFWTSSPIGNGKVNVVLESFSTRVHFEEEGIHYSRAVRCLKD
jgi:uncharacterized protein (TIGR02145 family)